MGRSFWRIMVDIYRKRTGYPYKCLYWKRDTSGAMDNEELVHKKVPTGVFYAKISTSKAKDTQDVAGIFRAGTEGLTIETNDIVFLDKDDLVQFNEDIWIVGRVNNEALQKNAEFGRFSSNKTFIELDKGR